MKRKKDINILFSYLQSGIKIILLTLAFLCIWLMQSDNCLAKKKSEPQNPAVETKKIGDYQKRLDKLLAPVTYRYSPAGKPDPFRPFFRTSAPTKQRPSQTAKKNKRPSKCDTPLECMDVGQLTLVGIVQEPDGKAIAMAQDASGIGYTLKPGMMIGYQKGKIVAIEREKVIVKEEVEDIKGNLTYRNRILYLHPEESDEAH